MDAATDELIQNVIDQRFTSRTVISIVHKLESALQDFDKVAVLDAGVLQEFGPPRELLDKGPEVSAFAALYKSFVREEEDKQSFVTVAEQSP